MNIFIATASVYTDLLNQAVVFAGTILLFALTALARKFQQRTGLKLSQENDAAVAAAVQRGISFAEEVARKKIGEIKLTGDDKLGIALKFVLSQIDAQGLKKRAEKEIEDLIHAELGTTRKLDPMLDMAKNIMSAFGPKPPVDAPEPAPTPAPDSAPTPPAAA